MKPSADRLLIRLRAVVSMALMASLLSSCALFSRGATPANPSASPISTTTKPAPKPKPEAPKPATAPDTTADPDTQFKAAMAALKAKDLATAKEGFAALAKSNPEFSGPLTNLGILEYKAKARDAAIADFTKAAAANPRNAIAYNWLGILYREAGNYPKAEQSYLKALDIRPDHPPVVLNLAILYDLYLKRPADALTRYRQYQQLTGGKELKVAAWIRMLEESNPAAAPTPPAAPVKPAAAPRKS